MIYPEPRYRPLGDCYLSVEFADTIHPIENFRVQALARALTERRPEGVVEVVPHIRSLAVVYDRTRTGIARLRDVVEEAVERVEVPTRVSSRLFRFPVWYDDPWSRLLAERYGAPDHLDYIAEVNDITKEEVVARHSGSDFWIAAVGFVPGCFWAIPLDFDLVLTAPKYPVPRDFTPARAIALAGLSTCIYPYAGPGGYQCIGRCAVELYRREPDEGGLFPADGILVRPGDRHRYVPIDAFEYDDVRERVRAGVYEYDVKEEEIDLTQYRTERAGDDVPEAEAGE